jgi:hypothetical protein
LSIETLSPSFKLFLTTNFVAFIGISILKFPDGSVTSITFDAMLSRGLENLLNGELCDETPFETK